MTKFLSKFFIATFVVLIVLGASACNYKEAAMIVDDEILAQKYEDTKKYNVISARGITHIAGLKPNGTVVCAGDNGNGQCDTESWRNVVAVFTSSGNTIGLKANGEIVVAGILDSNNINIREELKCEPGWDQSFVDIIDISIVYETTYDYYQCVYGLKKDGTCVVADNRFHLGIDIGNSQKLKEAVNELRDVKGIAAMNCLFSTVYVLKKDGSLWYLMEEGEHAYEWQDTGIRNVREIFQIMYSYVVILTGDNKLASFWWDWNNNELKQVFQIGNEIFDDSSVNNYENGEKVIDPRECFLMLNDNGDIIVPEGFYEKLEEHVNDFSLGSGYLQRRIEMLDELSKWKGIVDICNDYSGAIFAVDQNGDLLSFNNRHEMDLSNMKGLGRYKG